MMPAADPATILYAALLAKSEGDDDTARELGELMGDPEHAEVLAEGEVYGKAFRKAAAHAPAGGVTVGGREYKGGEFIPGDVMDKATDEERAAVEGVEPEAGSVPQSRVPDWADVFARLDAYTEGSGRLDLRKAYFKIADVIRAWDGRRRDGEPTGEELVEAMVKSRVVQTQVGLDKNKYIRANPSGEESAHPATGVKRGKLTTVTPDDLTFPGGFSDEVTALEDNRTMPVVVKKVGKKYRVMDGYGRSSGLINAGAGKVHVIIVSDADLKDLGRKSTDDPDWVAAMYKKYAPGLDPPGTTN